jgi:hypothetical protein
LWQVPYTSIDIKTITYFMRDWTADCGRGYLRYLWDGNKGFSRAGRIFYITLGYDVPVAVMAREVYVRDNRCFRAAFVHFINGKPEYLEINTASLAADVSYDLISAPLNYYIDDGFGQFVD